MRDWFGRFVSVRVCVCLRERERESSLVTRVYVRGVILVCEVQWLAGLRTTRGEFRTSAFVNQIE